MVAQNVYDLCRSNVSVSAELAKNPTEPPGEVAKRLFPKQSGNKVCDNWAPLGFNVDQTAPGAQQRRAYYCDSGGCSESARVRQMGDQQTQ